MRKTKMKKNGFLKKAISLCLTGVMLFTMQRVPMMAAETDNNVDNFVNEIFATMKTADKRAKASAPVQQISLNGSSSCAIAKDGSL